MIIGGFEAVTDEGGHDTIQVGFGVREERGVLVVIGINRKAHGRRNEDEIDEVAESGVKEILGFLASDGFDGPIRMKQRRSCAIFGQKRGKTAELYRVVINYGLDCDSGAAQRLDGRDDRGDEGGEI